MRSFEAKMKEYRDALEEALEKALPMDRKGETVCEAMQYSLLGGGKRVRGVLTLACCDMLCVEYRMALPAACAVEMVHAYSLIHDDLPSMDDDDLRRGKPSCHIKFGEAIALLAGDGLLTFAFEQLSTIQNVDLKSAIRCVEMLSKAAGYRGMIRGQELDLDAEQKTEISLDSLNNIHTHKTGRLISAAASMGGLIGNASPKELDAIDIYARNIGLAFQIVDDILDVTSSAEQIGKPVGSDAKQKKNTYTLLLGIEKSEQTVLDLTKSATVSLTVQFGEKASFLVELAEYLAIRKR